MSITELNNLSSFATPLHKTILRRIKRRMLLHQLDEMKDYVKFLRLHPEELDILLQDMLINVTSFFRDPETFEALKKEIFPRLIKQLANEKTLRIWVPACSTGEEVYSIAIVLFEFLGNEVNAMHIQIFASDIDKQAIDKARQGMHSHHIEKVVGIERLARFFIKTTNGYQICKTIRDMIVFATQNATQAPPLLPTRSDLLPQFINLSEYIATEKSLSYFLLCATF